MRIKKILLTPFLFGLATSLYSNECNEYLQSFEKQHKMLGKLMHKLPADRENAVLDQYIVFFEVNNILTAMNLNLKLMEINDCDNVPDYGIEILAYEKSAQDCKDYGKWNSLLTDYPLISEEDKLKAKKKMSELKASCGFTQRNKDAEY